MSDTWQCGFMLKCFFKHFFNGEKIIHIILITPHSTCSFDKEVITAWTQSVHTPIGFKFLLKILVRVIFWCLICIEDIFSYSQTLYKLVDNLSLVAHLFSPISFFSTLNFSFLLYFLSLLSHISQHGIWSILMLFYYYYFLS